MRSPDTMTVGELIEALEQFDPGDPVVVTYPYGDYPASIVCTEIGRHDVDVTEVAYSEYHQAFKVQVDEAGYDDEDPDDDEDDQNYVVAIGSRHN